MTLRILLITAVIFHFALPLAANPIDPRDAAAISEVQWIDSVTWSIEISDMALSYLSNDETEEIKLYIASSNSFYSFRVSLNEMGYGVITPDSLIGEGSEAVIIKAKDALFLPLPDIEPQEPSAYQWLLNETEGSLEDGWFCPIDSPESGHSLIGMGSGIFFESCRNSIGSYGDYTTVNHLQILDRDSLPFPGINLFTVDDSELFYTVFRKARSSDENGMVSQTVSLWSNTSYYIYDNDKFCEGYNNTRVPPWRLFYVDTATEISDTLVYTPNVHIISLRNENNNPALTLTPFFSYYPTFPFYNTKAGDSLGCGDYMVRLFPNADCEINFYALPDTIPVASYTCTYKDTRDTIYDTVNVVEGTLSTIRHQKNFMSEAFRILSGTSNNTRMVITNRIPVENASVHITSIDGRSIAVKNIHLRNTGTHTIRWDRTDKSGAPVTSGKYICRLMYGGTTVAVRTVMLF